MKIGIGYDSHRFETERPLILGGLEIPSEIGLLGHSDADVLTHAICDALLGAIGEGDLGRHFPDTDPRLKNISSLRILASINDLSLKKGYRIGNIDATVIIEKPRLSDHIAAMRHSLAQVLQIAPELINIKAKSNEAMGFLGRGEGAAALAVVAVAEREMAHGR